MKIKQITVGLNTVYQNLSSCYEAEFSAITGTLPLEDGSYKVQTPVFDENGNETQHRGFLAYESDVPIGFAVLGECDDRNDVAEFYIVPSHRGSGLGYALAEHLFSSFPGEWQVRQIDGATAARAFWRKVISKYTQGTFDEQEVDDPHWGKVTRQRFASFRGGKDA